MDADYAKKLEQAAKALDVLSDVAKALAKLAKLL